MRGWWDQVWENLDNDLTREVGTQRLHFPYDIGSWGQSKKNCLLLRGFSPNLALPLRHSKTFTVSLSHGSPVLCVLPPQAGEQLKQKGEAETGEDSVSSPAALSLLATFGHFLIPSPSIPHLPKMERRPLESPFPESLLAFYFFLPWSPLSAKAGPSHCPSPSTCIHSSRPHPSPWPPAMRDEGWGMRMDKPGQPGDTCRAAAS